MILVNGIINSIYFFSVDHLYRLGCDGKYKNYVNQYSTNSLALNKLQHNEERDKRRHLSHKFSLTSNADFKWNGVLYGKISV